MNELAPDQNMGKAEVIGALVLSAFCHTFMYGERTANGTPAGKKVCADPQTLPI